MSTSAIPGSIYSPDGRKGKVMNEVAMKLFQRIAWITLLALEEEGLIHRENAVRFIDTHKIEIVRKDGGYIPKVVKIE